MKKAILCVAFALVFQGSYAASEEKQKEFPPYQLPVLKKTIAERIACISKIKIDVKPSKESKGFSSSELFELHRELRLLVHKNYDKPPTPREREILTLLLYGKTSCEANTRRFINKLKVAGAKGEKSSIFGDGCRLTYLVKAYRDTNDLEYLRTAVVQAAFLMSNYHNKNPEENETFKLSLRKVRWLGIGVGYRAVAELIIDIVSNPTIHNYKSEAYPGINDPFKDLTYIQKAKLWMKDIKNVIDYRKSIDHYDNGKFYWKNATVNKKTNVNGPEATNGYLLYSHFLLAAAKAAELVDSTKYGTWAIQQQKTVSEVMKYFQTTFQNPDQLREARRNNMPWSDKDKAFTSEYGNYVTWPYAPEGNNTEDFVHLNMDIDGLDNILRLNPSLLPEKVKKQIAVALFVCTYNYKTGYIPFNMDPKDKGKNPLAIGTHTFFNPIYGKYVGRYLNDAAYKKFMDRQLLIWDDLLLKRKVEQISKYSMPRQVLEARWFRYNKDAVWSVMK